ncbi:MAG: hypothetical protein J6Q54_04695 [Oscillospiraceae bacterium]|nr:hypothetical protein [Oscillospiraceae bacterium]
MGYIAVIDTETNWIDQVMSIGTVIADRDSYAMIDAKYQVLTPEYLVGGMYESTLFADPKLQPSILNRADALTELTGWFQAYGVTEIFAYNASFDRNHLPELRGYAWYDIMRLAAYRQFNPKIPANADFCSTGRLKRNYGVEPMYRLLCGTSCYNETHNALHDAVDELKIMKALGHPLSAYIPLK